MTQTPTGQGKVSIIILSYNQGAMLREALASVEEARNANLLEMIIVDDGSSEPETTRILNEIEETGYRVLLLPNRGLSADRNAGIRLAKGEFILPLDGDNRLRDVYLNEGVSLLKNNPGIGVVYTDAEYFGERTGRWDVPDFNLLSLVRWNFIDVCALYRKSLWEELGGYDEQMPWIGLEDWDFWLRVASHGGNFVHLPKIGFDYRVRRDSLSVKSSPHAVELENYIFGKPEMAYYKLLREIMSYRLGRGLLDPARLLRKLWRCFH